ncbi:type II toxin-antitoxin system VapC family toxin [Candidatus Parcubacteria bacterium]|nr:MAG: type II toxin-antitoxin system VapC family toxin [Candidatus Parcubacteria bacterium]
MNVLLDTHAFLWWIDDNPKLSPRARGVISDAGNALFLSAASGWEMAIKARLGKLKLPDDLEHFIADQLVTNAFSSLPIQLSHALHVYTLPDYHRDPFDRILVAQGQLENMPILTADPQIAQYSVQVIW